MLELLTVIGIILIVSAIAFPTVMRFLRSYRLSGSAASVARMLQLARFQAIRMNRSNPPLMLRSQVIGNQNVVWIDLNNNGAPNPTEPQEMFSTQIRFLPAGMAPSVAGMGYPATQVSPGAVAFDPRGTVAFGVGAPVVYVYVLGYANQPAEGFRAVSLTPYGKTQLWSAAANGPWQKR